MANKNNYQHLSNAPITEALIDIRIQSEKLFEEHQFNKLFELIKKDYPNRQNQVNTMVNINSDEGSIKTHSPQITGYLLKNSNKTQMVQFRQNGFTYNKLAPYKNWEELRDEGKRLWGLYYKNLNPNKVIRIALRYINILSYKIPITFSDFITSPPIIPEGFHSQLNNFFTRISFPEENTKNNAILSQTLEIEPNSENASIILDIDAFNLSSFDPDDKEIWEQFEKLRNFKNDIFFKSITSKGLAKYK